MRITDFDPTSMVRRRTIHRVLGAALITTALIFAIGSIVATNRSNAVYQSRQQPVWTHNRNEFFTELAGQDPFTDDSVGHLARDLHQRLGEPNPIKAVTSFYLSDPVYPGIEHALNQTLTVPVDAREDNSGPLDPAFVIQVLQATPEHYRDLLVDPGHPRPALTPGLLTWSNLCLLGLVPLTALAVWLAGLAAGAAGLPALRAWRRRRRERKTLAVQNAHRKAQRAAARPEERELLDLIERLEGMPRTDRRDRVLAEARRTLGVVRSREATFEKIDDAERLDGIARRISELDTATREGVEVYRTAR